MSQGYQNVKYSLESDIEDPTSSSFNISPAFENNFSHRNKSKGKKYLGRNIPLVWKNNEPILTIGPDCITTLFSFIK